MPAKRTINSIAFACVLTFLGISVFCWGLKAKLSLYKIDQSKPAISCMAKLSVEKQADRTLASVAAPTAPMDLMRGFVAVVVAYTQGNSISVARLHSAYFSSLAPSGEHLRLLKLTRRPPPLLS